MDGIPCGCECEKLPVDPNNVYGGTYNPFTLDGDVFGVTLTVDGSSEVTVQITGMLDDPVECTVAIPDFYDAYDINKALASASTVSIQGESVRLVRTAPRVPLRFDACAVGTDGEILLTASSECSTGSNVMATQMPFYMRTQYGTENDFVPWPGFAQPADGFYAKSPPLGVGGATLLGSPLSNNACSFTIYRDGEEIASFMSPSVDGYELEYINENGDDGPDVSGVGSLTDPMELVGKAGKSWTLKVRPNKSGWLVFRWHGTWRYFPPGSYGELVEGEAVVKAQVTAGQAWSYSFAAWDDDSVVDVPMMYLVPDLYRHPFPDDVRELCQEEGSYLVVAKHEGDSANEMYVNRVPTPLISYGSFVILKTKYAYAMRLENDRWSDDPPTGSGDFYNQYDCYFENPFHTRIECGTGGPTKYENVAWNDPLHTGVDTATVHAVPQSGERGARPRFVVTRDGGDPSLVFEKPLTKFPLRFDKPVTGVTSGMVSVSGYTPPDGDGDTLPVVSLTRIGNSLTDYVVTIDTDGQVPNSMWTITFTPSDAIGMFAPSLPSKRYSSMDAFPQNGFRDFFHIDASTGDAYVWTGSSYRKASTPARSEAYASPSEFPADGKQGVVYIDASTGDDYVWSVTGYRRPTAEDCEEWGTTKLACRFMWCLGRDKSIGRYCINTKPDADTTMAVRASVSKQVDTPESRPAGAMRLTIQTSMAEVIDASSSARKTLSDEGSTGFLPRMPPDQTAETNGLFSYFGIPTTIHPAAPRWIGECQSPSEPQRHASMLFAEDDVLRLTVTSPDGLTCILFGDGMPQNFWTGTPFPEDVIAFSKRISYDGVRLTYRKTKIVTTSAKLTVSASRGRLTYRELNTTAVTELVLKVFSLFKKAAYRSANTYTTNNVGFDGHSPPPEDFDWGAWEEQPPVPDESKTFTIIVPPDREAELGELEDTDGGRWTIEKVED